MRMQLSNSALCRQMLKLKHFICLSSLCALFGVGNAEDVYAWHAAPVQGDEVAVLVLCPGMNSDGAHFLEEEPWMDFADTYNLGVIAINFSSDPEKMYSAEHAGYYWPEQGSGDALLQAVNQTYGKELPLLIYGFSGGAQFTSRFAEWIPSRITVWAAYSAQFWDAPVADSSKACPPGIVACGEYDNSRWFPSFSYFYKGRELGKPWTWVSISETGHHRKGSFEQFVRNYFAAILSTARSAGAYVDIDTEQSSGAELTADEQAELYTWLPGEHLLEEWQALHKQ